MKLTAKWIWRKQKHYSAYNQFALVRRRVRLAGFREARLAVSADTWYRLWVNGQWIADGPCRGWPEHYYYDLIDVTPYLEKGDNEIRILGHYFGAGTMHQVPQGPGILAQLDVRTGKAWKTVAASDASWQAAPVPERLSNVPRVSVQRGPSEYYDARRADSGRFGRAVERFDVEGAPWQDLQPRDCPLLTRKPLAPRAFREANVVDAEFETVSIPVRRLLHPGLVECGSFFSTGCAAATHIVAERARTVHIQSALGEVRVNARKGRNGAFRLNKGTNFVLVAMRDCFGHSNFRLEIGIKGHDGVRFENPLKPGHENPWVFVDFMADLFMQNDLVHQSHREPDREAYRAEYRVLRDDLLRKATDAASLKKEVGAGAVCRSSDEMLMPNAYAGFRHRCVRGDAAPLVESPGAMKYDNQEVAIVHPANNGAVELVLDMGEQTCGYWDLDFSTPQDGLVVDVFAVEHIEPDGRVQHTRDNHNGLRYYARSGRNRFTSVDRRSGRFIYITLRGLEAPLAFRRFCVIESTYPVEPRGAFRCSDPALDRIWEISERTLKLCMEDTFTDCPLYEQTLWVGDARNEALFAYGTFGAEDLSRRCLRLAAQSLERYPIVGCQVPSAWDVLLPAWSFLWGIAVWDYYHHSADRKFLREMWPAVRRNLKNAEKLVDARGLFSGPFWNMFDWSGADHHRRTAIHNSMLAVGAIDAAIGCAGVLEKKRDLQWLRRYRRKLAAAIEATWDESRQAYPDSIHDDGTPSPSFCIHNAFLATLYDVTKGERLEECARKTIDPPEDMVPVGSPFAIQYYYEALEKLGRGDLVLDSIERSYAPMLRRGATTVWETFGISHVGGSFPTRSHCHAWSSAPLYFLGRLVLGIVPMAPGGARVDIGPRVDRLDWAEGAVNTARGPVRVRWEKAGGNLLRIDAEAPEGVRLRYRPNETHRGLEVVFNGRKRKV